MTRRTLSLGMLGLALTAFLAVSMTRATAQGGDAPRIDNDDIGGVVTSTRGPEAGVWVIAETTDLPTKMAQDRGDRRPRPLRGSGSAEGQLQRLGSRLRSGGLGESDERARTDRESHGHSGAQPARRSRVLPGELLVRAGQPPDKSEFPGTGEKGNGISEAHAQPGAVDQQHQDVHVHARATRWATRRRARCRQNLGKFGTSVEAWNHRLQAGIDGGAGMYANTNRFGRDRVLKMFADWTDRIAGGEYPAGAAAAAGRRAQLRRHPVGLGDAIASISTTRWRATSATRRVNANGPVFGVHENSSDNMTILDPMQHKFAQVKIPGPRREAAPQPSQDRRGLAVLGRGDLLEQPSHRAQQRHGPEGTDCGTPRAPARPPHSPAFCKEGSTHPSAKLFPLNNSGRQYTVYDPKTKQWTHRRHLLRHVPPQLRARRQQHHLVGERRRRRLGQHEGARRNEATRRRHRAGRRSFSTPTATASRMRGWSRTLQSIRPRTSGSTRASTDRCEPGRRCGLGRRQRIPGRRRPRRARIESADRRRSRKSTKCRTGQVPGQHVLSARAAWTSTPTASSGPCWPAAIYASFDRRKCKAPLNGPNATGKHCKEGWSFYPVPGPNFKGNGRIGRRRLQLLQLGGQVRHARRRKERSDRHGQPLRRAARAAERQMGRRARAVSDWLLREADRRTHRRSARRLEGYAACGRRPRTARRGTSKAARARCRKVYKFQMRPDPLAR